MHSTPAHSEAFHPVEAKERISLNKCRISSRVVNRSCRQLTNTIHHICNPMHITLITLVLAVPALALAKAGTSQIRHDVQGITFKNLYSQPALRAIAEYNRSVFSLKTLPITFS